MEHLSSAEDSGYVLFVSFSNRYFHESTILSQNSVSFRDRSRIIAGGATPTVDYVKGILGKGRRFASASQNSTFFRLLVVVVLLAKRRAVVEVSIPVTYFAFLATLSVKLPEPHPSSRMTCPCRSSEQIIVELFLSIAPVKCNMLMLVFPESPLVVPILPRIFVILSHGQFV
jgi:hypothetical protein